MNQYDAAAAPEPPADLRARATKNALIAWVLLGISLIVAVILAAYVGYLTTKVGELEEGLDKADKARATLAKERDSARARAGGLAQEKAKLGTELEETQKEKQAAKRELERARKDLMAQLAAQIKRGEVFIQQRGADLVVDVSDKVLFDEGEAEITEGGQEVLKQVAPTLRRMRGHVFQIGGHTDAQRIISPDVRKKYPTNWELSTARATTVVRFLAEKCRVPGRQLVAAGYARYRPVASNATEAGKQRNRRIEMALLRELPT